MRGSEEQVAALRADEEFARRVTRADLIVESQGVIDAAIGEGITRGMAQYQGEVDALEEEYARPTFARPPARLTKEEVEEEAEQRG